MSEDLFRQSGPPGVTLPQEQPLPAEPPRVDAVPDDAQCRMLWDAYGMLQNIREHSELVACVATALAAAAAAA
nr:phosphohydrolase [Solidesulfovibrio sp.]